MVLLRVLSGLSLRFQRWEWWLRPPSSSLSVVSCLEMRGRLRLRELIRWSDPGSWSLKGCSKMVRWPSCYIVARGKKKKRRTHACACASNLQSVSSMSASASLSPWGSDSRHSSCVQIWITAKLIYQARWIIINKQKRESSNTSTCD